MPEWLWIIGALVFVVVMHIPMNMLYAKIYRPLQWRYKWAAHGLLLFGRREPGWERRG